MLKNCSRAERGGARSRLARLDKSAAKTATTLSMTADTPRCCESALRTFVTCCVGFAGGSIMVSESPRATGPPART